MKANGRMKRSFAWLLVLTLAFTMSFGNAVFATGNQENKVSIEQQVQQNSDVPEDEGSNVDNNSTNTQGTGVAAIGTKQYETLAEAVKEVPDRGTITLLEDCSGAGIGTFKAENSVKDFTIDFGGHTYTCTGPAVGSNGTASQAFHLEWKGATDSNANVMLKNGTITSTADSGVFMLVQNYCNLTLEDMILDGTNIGERNYTLSNNCGDVKVNNTTIIAPKEGFAFDSCDYSSYTGVKVSVSGDSDIRGKIELSNPNGGENNASIVITGGTFLTDPSAYVAKGYIATEQDGTWSVGETPKVVAIGDKKYETLAEAVKEVPDCGTITLLEDCSGAGIGTFKAENSVKDFTIDFGGHTYTCTGPAVGSNGTASQAFHLEWKGATNSNANVMLKNGTITSTADSGVFMLVQNYCNLTLEDMILDGTNIGEKNYTLSNNCGDVKVNNTTIIAPKEGFAFDSCDYSSYTGVKVSVSGDSDIRGKIELSNPNGGENNASIVITGGTFLTDPSDYVDEEEYKCTQVGDKYQVTEREKVAQIGEEQFKTLKAAVVAAKTGDTIKLLKNVEDSTSIYINEGKKIKLNLNGHNIIFKYKEHFTVCNGQLDIEGTGAVCEVEPYFAPVMLKGSINPDDSNYSVLNVGADVTLEGWAGVFVNQSKSDDKACNYGMVATLNGSKLISKKDSYGDGGAGIYVNGTIDNETNAPKITINDRTSIVSEDGYGMYLAGYADTTVNNATIIGEADGNSGIEIRAGKLKLNNSIVKGGSGRVEIESNGNGTTTRNAALAIAQHTTKLPIDVIINGGEYKGTYAIYEANPQNNSSEDIAKVKLVVNNGKFSGNVYTEDLNKYISTGYFITAINDNYLADGKTLVESDKAGYLYMVTERKEKPAGTVDTKPASKDPDVKVDDNLKLDTETEEQIKEAVSNTTVNLDAAARTQANETVVSETDAKEALGSIVAAKDAVTVYTQAYLDVKVTDYKAASSENEAPTYVLDIKPMYQLVASTAETADDINIDGKDGVKNAVAIGDPQPLEVNTAVEVTVPLPAGFMTEEKEQITVKHTKDDGTVYYYPADVKDGIAVFKNPHGFSTFELMVNSDNAAANLLEVKGAKLSPEFDKDVFEYTVNVEPNVDTVSIGATAEDPNAKAKVLAGGKEVKGDITLKTGLNEVYVVVLAENGTCNMYTVKINRRALSANADLKGISLSSGSLSPSFSAARTAYEASVANSVTSVKVTPAVSDSRAKVTVNGQAAGAAVALNEGRNTITVKVTAEDGKTVKAYTITVSRLAKVGAKYKYGSMYYKVKTVANGTGTVEAAGYSGNKLTSVKIPNTIAISGITYKVTAVGTKAFYKKSKLKTVTVGDNVSTIGTSAFEKCTALKTVTLGTGVTTIGKKAFSSDTKLASLKIKSSKLKSVGSSALYKAKNVKIKAPKSKVKTYKKLFKGKKAKKYSVVKL